MPLEGQVPRISQAVLRTAPPRSQEQTRGSTQDWSHTRGSASRPLFTLTLETHKGKPQNLGGQGTGLLTSERLTVRKCAVVGRGGGRWRCGPREERKGAGRGWRCDLEARGQPVLRSGTRFEGTASRGQPVGWPEN